MISGSAKRSKSFFKDPNIKPDKFAADNDHFLKSGAYRNLELTRGHMAAAANYSGNQDYKSSTFTYANVVPQNGYNNGGVWYTF
jgi:DNA/RNA endonuclease G (NUC1)